MSSPEMTVDRRTLIAVSAAGAAGAALTTATATGAQAATRYFQHGVASGDPKPRSVILWTRVTPTAAAAPGFGAGTPGHGDVAGRQGRRVPQGRGAGAVQHRPGA